jgi:replicative DNA helicase
MADFVDLLDPTYMSAFKRRQMEPIDAVPTPIPAWNRASGGDGGGEGLARKWLVTIGGNPKFGKTILSLNIAKKALLAGEKVGFMSLEMADPELATRFYAMAGQTAVRHLQKGRHFDPAVFDAACKDVEKVGYPNGKVPQLFVNSDPVFDLSQLLEHMAALAEAGVRYFIVDYLQLVSMDVDDEAVRVITRTVKALRLFARQNDSIVVLLSQFKRSASEDYTQSPRPQGLFGGGTIEQASDQILLLDHSLYEYEPANKIARTWLLLTNRHGEHGNIPILWDYRTLTVREGDPHEESHWPTRKKELRR